jgi:hypothetical protein
LTALSYSSSAVMMCVFPCSRNGLFRRSRFNLVERTHKRKLLSCALRAVGVQPAEHRYRNLAPLPLHFAQSRLNDGLDGHLLNEDAKDSFKTSLRPQWTQSIVWVPSYPLWGSLLG